MGSRNNPKNKRRSPLSIITVFGLCCFSYLLGTRHKSGFTKGYNIPMVITNNTECDDYFSTLDFESHNSITIPHSSKRKSNMLETCDVKYTDYTPCHEQDRAMTFPRENMVYTERHCPSQEERLKCLIPTPKGYSTPFPWPKGRDYVHYANVPFKHLIIDKSKECRVESRGNVFKLPADVAKFPYGADAYIDELARVIPIGYVGSSGGSIRTALDTGCGVATWGASMMKRNVLTMSFAPRDDNKAQVQFALERGVPAIIGVLGSVKLPFPSRAFDMAHCSRCLIPWGENDGMYLKEVDRVLRPGGFWILSSPPITWKAMRCHSWKPSREDPGSEQRRIEKLAESLCWEKIYYKMDMDIAIWRKKVNAESCKMNSTNVCKSSDVDSVWYKKMQTCVTPYPKVDAANEVAGGKLKKFPERLDAVPPLISKGLIRDVTVDSYIQYNRMWHLYVYTYRKINWLIGTSRYRNIMDMNAGLGGFAAALESDRSWVMNVVPTVAENTLGVIYERGLIGVYHDWCEGFSTYPRTYDLIHGSSLFSLYESECDLEDILLEMDRILRPEGMVILRDEVYVLTKVMQITASMRWDVKLVDHEDGPFVSKKIFVASKQYWVGNGTSSE